LNRIISGASLQADKTKSVDNPLREGIAALQENRCFHCGGPLASRLRSLHRVPAAASTPCVTASSPTGPAPSTSVTCSPTLAATEARPQRAPRCQARPARQGQPVGHPEDRRGRDSIDPQPPARRRHTSGLGSERLAGKTAAVLAALSRTGRMQAQLALPVGKLWHVFGTEGRQEPSTAGVGRTHECGTGFPASRGQ